MQADRRSEEEVNMNMGTLVMHSFLPVLVTFKGGGFFAVLCHVAHDTYL